MGKINMGRVILGGLVAGVVINIFEYVMNGVVFQKQWAEVMTGLGKSGDLSVKQIVALNAWGFAAGLLTVWLYAAIRPRFGAGPGTAICAGMVVWTLAFGMATAIPVFLKIYRLDMSLIVVGVNIVEMMIAGLVGGYLYKEEAAGGVKSSAAGA
jgi:hypothetical protein